MVKELMIKRFVLLNLLLVVGYLYTNAGIWNCRIVDANNGEAIIGATVINKTNGKGTVSDINGNFDLDITKFPAKVIVSYTGYKSQLLNIDNSRSVPEKILLSENVQSLSEVVVVGYGTQRRTQLTGSVTVVPTKMIDNTPALTLDGALGGAVAGLSVTQSSGQPGATSKVRIRGGNSINASNEPLYVVDGFIYYKDESSTKTGLSNMESSLNPLASINPSDIESVEVLKDISATAIYGSRGANGVIIVTTKKGKRGHTSISYRYSAGFDITSKKLDLMNAQQWARLQKDYFYNKGGYTDEDIKNLGDGYDWQSAVLRTGYRQQHEISVSGGDDKQHFLLSGNYNSEDGIVLNSGFKRYNFHINFDRELLAGLTVGANLSFGKSTQEGLTTNEATKYNSSPYSAGITSSLVYALLMPPVVPIYNADGSYNYSNPYEYAYFAIGNQTANPVSDLENSVAETINNYLLSNFYAKYKYKNWTAKISLGLNSDNIRQNFFAPSYTSLGLAVEGLGGVGTKLNEIWQQEYTLAWNKQLNRNNYVDALIGYTYQKSTTSYTSSSANHFTNEDLKYNNLSDGSQYYAPVTGASEATLGSFIGRVNYTLMDRYNVTATLRADHSSRFASGHEWGYFPSIGLSWNMNKENFLKDAKLIDNLKLRFSAGTVGNQEIGDYEYAQSYTAGKYNGTTSYSRSNLGNDNLKWETTASYNIGTDAGLFEGRLNLVLDVYYKKTSDLLLNVPVNSSTGVSEQLKNVGNVTNKGVEFGINTNIIKNKKIDWNVSANIAHNTNKITSMGDNNNLLQSNGEEILRVGESLGSFYGLQFAGIVQSDEDVSKLPTTNGDTPKAGDIKYADINGDNKIDGKDRVVLGNIQPDFTYGIMSTLNIGKLDIYVAFQGSHGNKVYNALRRTLEQPNDSYNVLVTVADSWTTTNPSNYLPLASNTRQYSYIDSRYVEDASYLSLKNLTIGYKWDIKKASLGIRVFATAGNLFILTPYKGYSPEVASGIDRGNYPASRSFTFGAEISL